jgi:hypothetical protein
VQPADRPLEAALLVVDGHHHVDVDRLHEMQSRPRAWDAPQGMLGGS